MKQIDTKKIVLSTFLCSFAISANAEDPISSTESAFKSFTNTNSQAPATQQATFKPFVNIADQTAPQTTPFKPFQPFGQGVTQPSIYGGLSLGSARLRDTCSSGSNSCKKDDTTWKVYGGYRINPQIAVQASYIDLGDFGADNNKTSIRGISASVLSPIAINEQLSVFGKAGFFKWESKTAQGEKISDIDPTFGVGVDYRFNENIAIRGELDHYKDLGLSKDRAANFQVLSVGVNYSTL